MQVTPGLLEGPGGRVGWRVHRDIARIFHDLSDGSEASGIFAVRTSPRSSSEERNHYLLLQEWLVAPALSPTCSGTWADLSFPSFSFPSYSRVLRWHLRAGVAPGEESGVVPPSCGEGKWTPGKSILFSSMQACWADGQRRASSTGILYGTRGNRSAAASLLERPGPGPH